MTKSHAVLWRIGHGPTYAGTVKLDGRELILEGSCHGRHPSSRTIRYDDLAGLSTTLAPAECLYGQLTLVLELREGDAVDVASMNGVEILREIRDRISAAVPHLSVD